MIVGIVNCCKGVESHGYALIEPNGNCAYGALIRDTVFECFKNSIPFRSDLKEIIVPEHVALLDTEG